MKVFYAVVSTGNLVVLNVLEWNNTRPSGPKTNAGTLVPCSASVKIGDTFNKDTGVFSAPQSDKIAAPQSANTAPMSSLSQVSAELAAVEKSVQVLMTQK
jgi:hypothetical protein